MKNVISIVLISLIISWPVDAKESNDLELALDLKCSLKILGLARYYVDQKVFDGSLGLYKSVASSGMIKEIESSVKDISKINLHDLNVNIFNQCIMENAKGHAISESFFKESNHSHECLKSVTIQNVYLVSSGFALTQDDAEKLYFLSIERIGLPNIEKYAKDMYSSKTLAEKSYKIKMEYFSCKKNIQGIYSDMSLEKLANIGNK